MAAGGARQPRPAHDRIAGGLTAGPGRGPGLRWRNGIAFGASPSSSECVFRLPPSAMIKHQSRGVVLLIAGIAMLAGAVLQAVVNVPDLREDLFDLGVHHTIVSGVTMVLVFTVLAMFAFAGIVLNSAYESWKGRLSPVAPLWIVAAVYVIYGAATFAFVGSPHLLGYALMGVLIASGALMRPPRQSHSTAERRARHTSR
jgi:hypothetical protein